MNAGRRIPYWTAHTNARRAAKRAHTIAQALKGAEGGFLTPLARTPTLARTFGARVRVLARAVKRETGCRPATDWLTCAAPATVSEGIAQAVQSRLRCMNKSFAHTGIHCAKNTSYGKEKRRFRQPGYRPEKKVGAAGMRRTSRRANVFRYRCNAARRSGYRPRPRHAVVPVSAARGFCMPHTT